MSNRLSTECSRRNFLALLGTASSVYGKTSPGTLLSTVTEERSSALPSAAVVRGNVRFQILSPTVMRMEYVPAGHFIDAPSVSLVNRNWPACPVQVHDAGGWVDITTNKMRVKYKLDSGKFEAGNLAVSWKDADGDRTWKPGDVDDKNLGGVPGDGGGTIKPPNEQPGALSRNGYFRLDDSGTAVWNTTTEWPEPRPNREEAQDWYFFAYGLDYKLLLRELAQLLGPIPMVPRYIFGTWFMSCAAYSSDEWQRIVYRFREEEIPLDVVMLDSGSSAAVIWRGFSWDPEQLSDPPAFFAWMKAHGIKVGVNEHYEPMTPESDTHFDRIRQALGLPAGTRQIAHDIANKKYAQMFMDILHKPALDMGMAFWEPDGSAPSSMPGLDTMFWTRHIEYTGTERITGKRAVIMCRLGVGSSPPVWGAHRYGLFFAGDGVPRWWVFKSIVRFNVRAGNILAAYAGHAGPFGALEETLDHELYQRSVQFAAFCPVFWWHSVHGLRLPWEYGEDCVATVKQFLGLRYQLQPYIYTYARLAHETGVPLVRGTYLEYPQQERAYTFTQQSLFGQELLVAPITEPGGGQPVRQAIYLPEGEHWFDYFTGRIYAGGQVLSYECPLSRTPLFVKAGSILPMTPEMDYTEQGPNDPLILDVYAGKAATFRLYEDDGTSLDYRKGAIAWTPLSYQPSPPSGDHVITIGPTEGEYQGQLRARRYRVRVHGLLRPARVRVRGRLLPEKRRGDVTGEGWVWRRAEQVATIDLPLPVGIREAVRVTIEQAGEFPDAVAVDTVRAFRARVRSIKTIQHLRWAMLLDGALTGNEPHVLQVTEGIEQALNDLVDHPVGLAARPPDLRGMTAAVLDAFVNKPFAATRKQPSKDPDYRTAQELIVPGAFTLDELHRMTIQLVACQLEASVVGTIDISKRNYVEGPVVSVRFRYDTTIIGPPQLSYEFSFPDEGSPGWVELRRSTSPYTHGVLSESNVYFTPPDGDGSATFFSIRAPYPPQQGSHTLKLRVSASWGPIETVQEREIVWTVSADEANPSR